MPAQQQQSYRHSSISESICILLWVGLVGRRNLVSCPFCSAIMQTLQMRWASAWTLRDCREHEP
eukprot:5408734-Amphidinium_carterae.1